MSIKTHEELHDFEVRTQLKIKELEDNDLIMTKQLQQALTVISDMKSWQKDGFLSTSKDEQNHQMGSFFLALLRKDTAKAMELGGRFVTSSQENGWNIPADGKEWNIGQKAAPDLGTPLRGDSTTGSYLIPEAWAAEILRIPTDPSALMGKVRTVPMAARKINYPAKLTGVTFSWPANETAAKTETNPTFSDIDLEALTAAGWIAFSEELNEDSVGPGLAEYFASLFRESWSLEFDKQCLAASSDPFTGILANSSVNTVTMGSSSFSSVTLDDLGNLIASLDDQSKRNGASFIMHVTVLDLFRTLRDDNGEYVFQKPAEGQPGTIWNYPVLLSDAMPDKADSASSTAFIAFGNPKWILHGERVGLELKIFDSTADALVYDRLFLRARIRAAFKCAFPGAWSRLKTGA